MELNWSTFVLEIVNFIVLVFILQRFLYRPVLDVIERRRKSVEDRLDEAHRIEEAAEALKEQYNGRLTQWQSEQRTAREALAAEIENERSRRLTELTAELDAQKRKVAVAERRQHAEQQRTAERLALMQGSAFASRLLTQACVPELEARLVKMLVEDLTHLDDDQIAALRQQWSEPQHPIEIASAFPLTSEQRANLESALETIGARSLPVDFTRDESLLAGIRISIGAWVLGANVRDELQGFAEIANVPR